jgi:hypothetical protein
VIDRIGVGCVAEAIFVQAAGVLRAHGEHPLIDQHILPQRGVVPQLVVDIGGDQRLAIREGTKFSMRFSPRSTAIASPAE